MLARPQQPPNIPGGMWPVIRTRSLVCSALSRRRQGGWWAFSDARKLAVGAEAGGEGGAKTGEDARRGEGAGACGLRERYVSRFTVPEGARGRDTEDTRALPTVRAAGRGLVPGFTLPLDVAAWKGWNHRHRCARR